MPKQGWCRGAWGALDGTKIKAVAALAANRTAATIEKAVATMLAEARRVDEAEACVDGTNREALPEAVRNRTSRPARRYECQKRLTRTAADATAKASDGPGEPHHADPTRVRARIQRPSGRS